MRALHKNDTRECIRLLTEYKGVGEGFFPTEDGLVRRYDPKEIGDGYHASVEYTFDLEDDDLIIFCNALGTQDRENYEAAKAKAKLKRRQRKPKKRDNEVFTN